MREIKFRGKRVDNDEWIYGSLVVLARYSYYIKDDSLKILNPRSISTEGWADVRCFKVDYSTVGQYTGLKDKNGVEVYEGDIYHQGDKNILYVVVWHDTSFIGKQLKSSSYAGLTYWLDRIEIIGNIHDNPELISSQQR